MNIWIIIWILIIVLIIAILLWLRYLSINDDPKIYEDFDINNFHTGDLIFNTNGHAASLLVCSIQGSKWGHVGLIWVDPDTDERYVLELAGYKHPYKGVCKIPLMTWLYINKRSQCMGHLKLHKLNDEYIELDKTFLRYKNIKRDDFGWRWLKFLTYTDYEELDVNGRYACHELIIQTLQLEGIYRKDYSASTYSPSEMANREIPMENEYFYEEIVGIKIPNNIPKP